MKYQSNMTKLKIGMLKMEQRFSDLENIYVHVFNKQLNRNIANCPDLITFIIYCIQLNKNDRKGNTHLQSSWYIDILMLCHNRKIDHI